MYHLFSVENNKNLTGFIRVLYHEKLLKQTDRHQTSQLQEKLKPAANPQQIVISDVPDFFPFFFVSLTDGQADGWLHR